MQLLRRLGTRRLARDTRGAAMVEFAIVLPAFLVLLFGIYDAGQLIYAQSVLQGSLQDAGRDAGLERGTNQLATIDKYVKDQTGPIVFGNPTYTIDRKNYKTFSDVRRPEEREDTNSDGVLDDKDCWWEENGTDGWQDDVGKGGVGGANDVSVYTVTIEYDRIFPLWKLIGISEKAKISSSTTLRNQPYGPQAGRAKKRTCPGAPA